MRSCLPWLLAVVCACRSAGGADTRELRLRGTVVDEMGAPAAGVEVKILGRRGGQQSTTTDVDGRFELVAPLQRVKSALVRASADGSRLQGYFQIPWQEARAPQREIELRLKPARRIETQVADSLGNPVEGAAVSLVVAESLYEAAATDAQGWAALWAPSSPDEQQVIAISKEHGVDYRSFQWQSDQSGEFRGDAPELTEAIIPLMLDGRRTVCVRVVDSEGKPLVNERVYPWTLTKPGESGWINLSFLTDFTEEQTDDEGVAVFDWLPAWHTGSLKFWPVVKTHVYRSETLEAGREDAVLPIVLDRLVPIRGQVTLSDGTAAAGATVTASGRGSLPDVFHGTAITDEEGRYEIMAAPNMAYLVVAHREALAAEPRTGFAVMPDAPVENLDFELRPATRLFGRVTEGVEVQGVPEARISVYQHGKPAAAIERGAPPPIERLAQSADDGRYEMWLGPGEYAISGPGSASGGPGFQVVDEEPLEFNFHSDRLSRGLLRGLVVAEPPDDAVGAKVEGLYIEPTTTRGFYARSGAGGKFSVERERVRTSLYARSADNRLAGVGETGPDDQLAVIHLRRTIEASGRLIDRATGQPVAGYQVKWYSNVYQGSDVERRRTTVTDRDGRFTLTGIIPEVPYDVYVGVPDAEEPGRIRLMLTADLKTADSKNLELGDLRFDNRK